MYEDDDDEDCRLIEDGPPANVCYVVMLAYLVFCSCDLELDLMTVTYENYKLDLDILKMCVYQHEVSRSRLSKARAQTGDIHTNAQW